MCGILLKTNLTKIIITTFTATPQQLCLGLLVGRWGRVVLPLIPNYVSKRSWTRQWTPKSWHLLMQVPVHKNFPKGIRKVSVNINVCTHCTQIFSILPICEKKRNLSFQWLVWADLVLQILSQWVCRCEIVTLSSFLMSNFDLCFVLVEATADFCI